MSKEPPDKGGWNVYFTIIDGLFNANPATNSAIRGDGKSGMDGWPNSPRLEALREAWLDAAELDDREADRRADAATDVAGRAVHPDGALGPINRASAQHRRSALGLSRVLRRAARLTQYRRGPADRAMLPVATLEAE